MTTETEMVRERLRPRIIETGDMGRLDLGLPAAPQPEITPQQNQASRSPLAVAATGLGVMSVGVVGIDQAKFIDGAIAHGTAVGVVAAATVAARAGRAGYWHLTE
jgi:hypothetical protein